MTPVSNAEELSKLLLVPENSMKSQIAQVDHRLAMIQVWGGIPPNTKVLELGCGQGDCTIAIADAVGEHGMVEAVDPAPPGYGSPYTVEQAQKYISNGPLGRRIKWIRANPLELPEINSGIQQYDIGILAHCLWYFPSVAVIRETLHKLGKVCKQVYVAEWSLYTQDPAAQPHVYSTLTQASLECRKAESVSNVRTVVSPNAIKKLAEEAGLEVVLEGDICPKGGLLDGQWEVGAVYSKDFIQEVEDNVINEKEKAVVFALRDSMLKSLEVVPGGRKAVRSMNVWCGVLEAKKA